jgi:integrase
MGQGRIEVRVVPFADRTALQLQWTDASTGLRKTRSARTNDPEEAERRRADLEYELNHGLHACGTRTSWERFRAAFEAEYLPGLRCGTRKIYATIFDHFERICQPSGMDGITARTMSQFLAGLRQVKGRGESGQNGMQASTLFVRLGYFHAALKWAHAQGMLAAVPSFPEVKVPKKKPQPVPTDLYERLFVAAQKGTRSGVCKGDGSYLCAFVACGWLAGLRLGEAQLLSWEPSERAPWIDLDRSGIWLPAGFVKAVEDQWIALDGQLRELLLALPRTGPHVFPWHDLSREAVGDKVIALARRAKVPLTMRSLRRGFACFWALRVLPQTLQQMLRHASINTTFSYYATVGSAADEAIRSRNGNSSTNTPSTEPLEH